MKMHCSDELFLQSCAFLLQQFSTVCCIMLAGKILEKFLTPIDSWNGGEVINTKRIWYILGELWLIQIKKKKKTVNITDRPIK